MRMEQWCFPSPGPTSSSPPQTLGTPKPLSPKPLSSYVTRRRERSCKEAAASSHAESKDDASCSSTVSFSSLSSDVPVSPGGAAPAGAGIQRSRSASSAGAAPSLQPTDPAAAAPPHTDSSLLVEDAPSLHEAQRPQINGRSAMRPLVGPVDVGFAELTLEDYDELTVPRLHITTRREAIDDEGISLLLSTLDAIFARGEPLTVLYDLRLASLPSRRQINLALDWISENSHLLDRYHPDLNPNSTLTRICSTGITLTLTLTQP